ncbi:MAG: glutamate-5-semialdehyde dehydrogenase [Planctomycetota bacterium]
MSSTAVVNSANSEITDFAAYAQRVAGQAAKAGQALLTVTGSQKNQWLQAAAAALRARTAEVLTANARDVELAPGYGLNAAAIDRLTLTPARLENLAKALEEIVALPDPVGEILDSSIRPNGLQVMRVRVPLGVVFFIYESRPNVTMDAAALCVKSGNAVILRGGKEAFHSNQALYGLLQDTLRASGLPQHAVQLVETTDRAAVGEFLKRHQEISVTIPRGGKSLIERVVAEATMPVIKHYDGVCHVYIDQSAEWEMARNILINSKCQRPGVCNAAECLLIHASLAAEWLPKLAAELAAQKVQLRCCTQSQSLMPGSRLATDDDYRTEYSDLILSVKVVADLTAAVEHISEYGSGHTESIVTSDLRTAQQFVARVDSAAVIVNASTRFNDGGELGLGAEIGISTDKIHARGPCGLRELTSYKYVVYGDGQVRG